MSAIYKGQQLTGPVVITNWSPSKGYTTTLTYKGTKDAVNSYAATLSGVEYNITNDGPVYTISVSTVTDQNNNEPDPIVSWELQANVLEKDLLDSDCNLVKTLFPAHIQQLKQALKNPPKDGGNPFLTVAGVTSTQLRQAYTVWNLLLLGVKAVPTNLPILKRQMTVSNTYVIQNSITNVDRIYSTNTLVGQEAVPNTITGCIPYPTTAEITSPISKLIKLHYGWKKHYPVILRVAEIKYQVSQEWHYGLWSQDVYGELL